MGPVYKIFTSPVNASETSETLQRGSGENGNISWVLAQFVPVVIFSHDSKLITIEKQNFCTEACRKVRLRFGIESTTILKAISTCVWISWLNQSKKLYNLFIKTKPTKNNSNPSSNKKIKDNNVYFVKLSPVANYCYF